MAASMKDAKVMMNMAESIAKVTNNSIERLDLNLTHMGMGGKFDFYILDVWYSDGKQLTIREDCTIVDKDN